MKKRKLLKNVSLVALSAVMLSGVALASTACGGGGGGDPQTITVYIFCNRSDEFTNRTICEDWAKDYAAAHPELGEVKVNLSVNYEKGEYFTALNNAWAAGNVQDVIYLSPKYVQSYVNAGNVLDLAPYILADGQGETIGSIWNNAISYYGYVKNDKNYTLGQSIKYDANGSEGAGFYTADGSSSVGIFGLPKDYSNFSMGYNKVYFSDALREAYQLTKGSQVRQVASASEIAGTAYGSQGKSYVSQYTGYTGGKYAEDNVATYAATGWYTVTLADGTTKEIYAQEGEEAPLICPGVPVTYKPFNFYRYNSFSEALEGGDPMACMVDKLSYLGSGYTVTLPGFPGDTFDIDNDVYENTNDEDAPYDSTMGHIVYTYAEYGALVWAVTYYLNTFNWSAYETGKFTVSGTGAISAQAKEDNGAFSGSAGIVVEQTDADGNPTGSTIRQPIYGSEQYEGTQGNALYLLPWLASNDADIINTASTACYNLGDYADAAVAAKVAQYRESNDDEGLANYLSGLLASQQGRNGTNPVEKLNLDGSTRTSDVQYGINSERFIETYAAYQEFGSTWNGNSGNAGDQEKTKDSVSGWDFFCAGAAVFYGAGTWDAATRNETKMDVFEFGQMPSPVAEKYALYSRVNDADYTRGGKEYSNANNVKGTGNAANGTSSTSGDGAQRVTPSDGCKVYSDAQGQNTYNELIKNQIIRQDKWAARMDSVGYAANGRFATMSEDNPEYWKAAGCASLIQALTIGKTEQVTLTYAGAQLPNYESQCLDFLYYQDSTYANYAGGDFKDMITPEGSYNVGGHKTAEEIAAGRALWNQYYEVALRMGEASNNPAQNSQTVKQWMDANAPTLKFDEQYSDIKLSAFTGESDNHYAFAMKVLRMVAFTFADRDLNIRMQYGLNSVRDSSMYTTDDGWLGVINGSTSTNMLAYVNQKSLDETAITNLASNNGISVGRTDGQKLNATVTIWTPAVYCINYAMQAQTELNKNATV